MRAYAECVSAGACTPTATTGDCNAAQPQARAEHPINCVSQAQAERYCAFRSARLPTVAEWQLAASGGDRRAYPWGDASPSTLWVGDAPDGEYPPGPARHNLCWQGDGTARGEKYPSSTCPVGAFSAGDTPSGIADLAGNVWEWTTDASGVSDGVPSYTVKGGGFGYDRLGPLEVRGARAAHDLVKVTDTRSYPKDYYARDVGFRCVR